MILKIEKHTNRIRQEKRGNYVSDYAAVFIGPTI